MASPGYPREHIDALLAGIRVEMATKSDMAAVRADLRTELADLRGEMRTESAKVRSDMAEFRAEFRSGMASTRGALRAEMETMEGRLCSQVDGLRREVKVWFLVLGAILTVISSGGGSRVLNLLWPAGPGAPPVSIGAPLHR